MGVLVPIRLIGVAASIFAAVKVLTAPSSSNLFYEQIGKSLVFYALLLVLGVFLGRWLILISVGLLAGGIILPQELRSSMAQSIQASGPAAVSELMIIYGVLGLIYSALVTPLDIMLSEAVSPRKKSPQKPSPPPKQTTPSLDQPRARAYSRLIEKKLEEASETLYNSKARLKSLQYERDHERSFMATETTRRYRMLEEQIETARGEISRQKSTIARLKKEFKKAVEKEHSS
ncbi:MAG: hypothetical protein WA949_08405 [Phormidesmis sp.]